MAPGRRVQSPAVKAKGTARESAKCPTLSWIQVNAVLAMKPSSSIVMVQVALVSKSRWYCIAAFLETTFVTVDGAWSRWSKWGSCIGPCGSSAGIKNRTRTCDDPSPLNDGNDCIGSGIQHSNCNTELCPRDGGWSQWSEWVGCTATCYGNGGIHTRKRYCTDPLPLRGGDECSTGESQEWEACGQYLCPVWTTDTRLGYANFHYSAPDYLHTNECDVHPAETNAKLPANYILGALGNNPQLSVAMDFGFDVTINGVYLKNSQNSFARNQ